MKLLKNASMKSFASTWAPSRGATLRDQTHRKLYIDQKYQRISKAQFRSLVHMLGGLVLMIGLLSACSMPGISSTAKKQAPAPKILGSGTLVNNLVLYDGGMGEPRNGFGMSMVTARVGWGMRPMDANEDAGGILYRTTDGGKSWQLLY